MATPSGESINKTIDYLIAEGGFMSAGGTDTFWLIMCGVLVFFMQCGFALLEAGTVRAKNTKNILLKNMLDACIGAVIWWSIGFMIAYDTGNGFIGATETKGVAPSFFLQGYVGSNEDDYGYAFALWWFQYVFAAAAATIVSGAMAERTALTGYIIYTIFITAFVYPVVVHWGWSSEGWISAFNGLTGDKAPYKGGLQDFAGSGIVHMTGGIAALVGAATVGPRIGRFDEAKKALPLNGHSATLQVMGTFILWFGWYGFNPGSTLGISAPGYSRDAARCVVTTTLSAAGGGLMVVLLEKLLGDKTWSIGAVCNGILGGLVSITAGCSVTLPWTAFIIGLFGGIVYFGSSKCVLHVCKVDDPLDAFAVHGACGFWGVFAVGLFSYPGYAYASGVGGFYGGTDALNAAVVFLFANIAWTGTMSALMFIPLKLVGLLRVPADVEQAGMDTSKHGGPAYESEKP